MSKPGCGVTILSRENPLSWVHLYRWTYQFWMEMETVMNHSRVFMERTYIHRPHTKRETLILQCKCVYFTVKSLAWSVITVLAHKKIAFKKPKLTTTTTKSNFLLFPSWSFSFLLLSQRTFTRKHIRCSMSMIWSWAESQ